MMSSTSSAATPERLSASATTILPSSTIGVLASEPRYASVTGVRAYETMTASPMARRLADAPVRVVSRGGVSKQGRPRRGAEQPALPAVAQRQRLRHPRVLGVRGRLLVRQEPQEVVVR